VIGAAGFFHRDGRIALTAAIDGLPYGLNAK